MTGSRVGSNTGKADGYRRLRNILLAVFSIFSLFNIAGAGWYLWSERVELIGVEKSRSQTLSSALEEHVLRLFSDIDQQMQRSASKLVELRALERSSTPTVVEFLRQEKPQSGFVRSLHLYDASGRGHTTSLGTDITGLHARNSEHFREIFESGTDRLAIGRVTPGPVTRRPSIQVARGILDKQGRFAGIIGVALEPAYFENFYKRLGLDEGESIALLRKDGAILVRVPPLLVPVANVSDMHLLDTLSRQSAGTIELHSPFDGKRRNVAFRHVAGWDLIVVHSQTYAAMLAPWWRLARTIALIGSAWLLFLFMLLRFSLRELARRRDAELEVASRERNYHDLLEQAADAIFVADARGRYCEANRAACELLGYTREELLSMSITDLTDAEELKVAPLRLSELQEGRSIVSERRLRRKDGTFVSVELNAKRMVNGRFQSVARDLTDSKRLEIALHATNEVLEKRVIERTLALERALAAAEIAKADADQQRTMAETANRAKSEFLSHMSHELRTPMNAIMGFAQILRTDASEGEQRQYMEEILGASEHLLFLIDDLLDLSRIEAGKLVMTLQPVRLGPLITEALRLISIQAANTGVVLNNLCSDEVCVIADWVRLRQILINLLSNAVKFNRSGGTVDVECERVSDPNGGQLRIRVVDTGAGISPEQIERIFVPFERLQASKLGIGGTGIGLALCKHLAELQGGSIGVESQPGSGSAFWVQLPLGECEAAPHALPQNASAVPRQPIAKVLYVEDNAANLRLVEAIFRKYPELAILSATSGETGIELARSHQPHLILLDIHLPGLSGYEVLAALRADAATRAIPVIALSADAAPIDIARGLVAGFQRYLTKPIKTEELIEAIDDCMAQRNTQSPPP